MEVIFGLLLGYLFTNDITTWFRFKYFHLHLMISLIYFLLFIVSFLEYIYDFRYKYVYINVFK